MTSMCTHATCSNSICCILFATCLWACGPTKCLCDTFVLVFLFCLTLSGIHVPCWPLNSSVLVSSFCVPPLLLFSLPPCLSRLFVFASCASASCVVLARFRVVVSPPFFVLPCGASFSASFAVLSRLLLLLCCPLVLLPSAAARLSWFLSSRRVWL